jgi:hypothetical protein
MIKLSKIPPYAWLASLAVATTVVGALGYQLHRQQAELDFTDHRTELLQSENARLLGLLTQSEKSSARAEDLAQRNAIEESIAKIRGLDFVQPVIYDVLSREGIKKTVAQKIDEQYTAADFKNIATGLSALGLLPPDYPLKQKYIDLLGEQIAAFYDQHKHKLFMFEDASLSTGQNRIILAHELTHALQDQHFGLLKLPIEVKNNDDLALAASALVEGDATLAMSDYMLRNFSLKALRENISGLFTQNMEQLQKAPRYLREMLVFPYLRGQEFCTAIQSRGSFDTLNEVYKNPPASSSQILHPEKYFAHEQPVRVEFGDTAVLGQKPLADNVLGEMGVRILFSEWIDDATGKAASQGWRGDRYLVYDDGRALVWRSAWASKEDAEKFRDALSAYVDNRFGSGQVVQVMSSRINTVFSTQEKTDAGLPWLSGCIVAQGKNEVVFIWAMKGEFYKALCEKFGVKP